MQYGFTCLECLIRMELDRIRESIAYIDRKQSFYEDVLSGRTPYFSNLTGAGD